MTHTQHPPLGQPRDAHGGLTAIRVPAALGLAPSPAPLAAPSACARSLNVFGTCPPRGSASTRPVGHEAWRLLGAYGPPLFAHHRHVAAMTPPHAGPLRPKRCAALPARRSGPPAALVILVRPMGHAIVARWVLHGLRGPGHGPDPAPGAGSLRLGPVLHHAPGRFGASGGLPTPQDQRGPRGGPPASPSARPTTLARRSAAGRVGKMRRPLPGTRSPSPAASRRPKRQPHPPGGGWRLRPGGTTGCLVPPVAAWLPSPQRARLPGAGAGQGARSSGAHQRTSRCTGQEAAVSQRPKSATRCPGQASTWPALPRAPWVPGWQADAPTKEPTMAPAPPRRPAAPDQGHPPRQSGAGDQPGQSPRPRRQREHRCRGQGSCRLDTFCH
jgi:hypothetical protein